MGIPTQLKTLEDLVAQAEDYASFAMRSLGHVPPTLFLIGPDGPQVFMPQSMGDEDSKDDFATAARLLCIAHAATAVVMVLEVWAKFATPGEPFDQTERPSEAFDRQEVVVLSGEERGAQQQRFLPILRTDAGGFFGFGEPVMPGADTIKGRFAQLLPPKAPDAEARLLARAMLQLKGIAVAQPGTEEGPPGASG